MGNRESVSRRGTGLIVAVLGLWSLFVICMGLGFVASYTSENSSADLTNTELRSAAIEWTIVATIVAAVLLAPVAVSRRRARGCAACVGSKAERSTPSSDR
ncbi:hypothetical protein [Plantactinospora sp. KLBMP9567]|uniref:hypothetical protein n=1 Tax=Plantactinospora sp. KLBMP9567 TaxID=3085900 RepID=UPI00298294AF|nr:hypothetical protein [Plantactinospora sp. KLBMP9567]MDW5324790.1 hypothetical protein [Plantactinospora sp. KLBMP9567]